MSALAMTPQQLAQAASEALHEQDFAAQMMGIEIIETTPGRAVLKMTVRPDMSNGHGMCHGGMIFTLCDTAFAHACNNTNKNTVASGCSIDYMAPGHLGDVLTATAQERSRTGRVGVYDIEVTRTDGTLVAVFRGKSYQIKGQLIAD